MTSTEGVGNCVFTLHVRHGDMFGPPSHSKCACGFLCQTADGGGSEVVSITAQVFFAGVSLSALASPQCRIVLF